VVLQIVEAADFDRVAGGGEDADMRFVDLFIVLFLSG